MKIVCKSLAYLLLLFLLLCAGFVAYNWAPDVPVEELTERWAPTPSKFLEIEGMQVHYRDEGVGDGEVLLLLHGTSASLHTWEQWLPVLKDKYRVISLDLPGFGLTGPFPDGDYRLAHYSAFLERFTNELGIDKASLIGNSFGGQLAWQFAVDYPEQVENLVLIDASGYPRESTAVPLGFRLASIPLLRPIMAKMLPRGLIESSVRNVYGDKQKPDAELIDRYYQLALREGNRAALRARLEQSEIGVDPSTIKQIEQPTLIIWGALDQLVAPINAQRFARDIAGSEMLIFDDLGHVPHEEDPQRTAAATLVFLQKHARPNN